MSMLFTKYTATYYNDNDPSGTDIIVSLIHDGGDLYFGKLTFKDLDKPICKTLSDIITDGSLSITTSTTLTIDTDGANPRYGTIASTPNIIENNDEIDLYFQDLNGTTYFEINILEPGEANDNFSKEFIFDFKVSPQSGGMRDPSGLSIFTLRFNVSESPGGTQNVSLDVKSDNINFTPGDISLDYSNDNDQYIEDFEDNFKIIFDPDNVEISFQDFLSSQWNWGSETNLKLRKKGSLVSSDFDPYDTFKVTFVQLTFTDGNNSINAFMVDDLNLDNSGNVIDIVAALSTDPSDISNDYDTSSVPVINTIPFLSWLLNGNGDLYAQIEFNIDASTQSRYLGNDIVRTQNKPIFLTEPVRLNVSGLTRIVIILTILLMFFVSFAVMCFRRIFS